MAQLADEVLERAGVRAHGRKADEQGVALGRQLQQAEVRQRPARKVEGTAPLFVKEAADGLVSRAAVEAGEVNRLEGETRRFGDHL